MHCFCLPTGSHSASCKVSGLSLLGSSSQKWMRASFNLMMANCRKVQRGKRGRDKESPGGKQMYRSCRRAKSTAFIQRLCREKCHLIIRVERPFSAIWETWYSKDFYKMRGSFSLRAFQEQGWFRSLLYPKRFLMNIVLFFLSLLFSFFTRANIFYIF